MGIENHSRVHVGEGWGAAEIGDWLHAERLIRKCIYYA